ncbi:MAG: tripartite tricarboxylate transporter permease [Desulfovibrio sp.]|jgi:putative tricarboxylic transport membrane protein|nr:tripartite tricarboxylate transporter permease [Desulfovibrio sp.]
MSEFILPALANLCNPLNILLMLGGLAGGIIIGALPGLTATMGVALMVPVTFVMDTTSGLVMLGAIYVGAIYGGSNSACLICTPGTPSSVATTFDGWPMCQAGKADKALITSLLSSSFGGIVGTFALLFLAAPLARFALKFGGPENFWLCLFGLSTIAVMSSGNMFKGLVSGGIGMLVATIGLDPHMAVPRFTFGYYPLVQGVEVIPAMIGLFSISQVLYLVGSYKPFLARYNPTPGVFGIVARELLGKCKTVLLRSSFIGTLVGMLPGAGGEIASIIAYNESKRWDKQPERYGTGVVEGVASSESANNAVIGGSLIPMLTLGIPGSAVAAVILGALLAKGIQPGFKVFTVSGELAYTFILSQFAVNLLMIPVGLLLVRLLVRLLSVRLTHVAISIVLLSVIGSYAIRNSMLDVWIALLFGVFGWFCNRVKLDTGAMALGIILGPMIEENFGKCVSLAKAPGSSIPQVFLDSPIALVLICLTLLSLGTPFLMRLRRQRPVTETAPSAQSTPAAGVDWLKDILAGFFTLLISAVFFTQVFELEDVGRNYALLLLAFIILMGLYLCVQGLLGKRLWGGGASSGNGDEPVVMRRVAVIIAASAAYAGFIPILGFYPASAFFLCLSAIVLNDSEGSPYFAACLLTLVMCLAVWLVFTMLLGVPTPESMLFQ